MVELAIAISVTAITLKLLGIWERGRGRTHERQISALRDEIRALRGDRNDALLAAFEQIESQGKRVERLEAEVLIGGGGVRS